MLEVFWRGRFQWCICFALSIRRGMLEIGVIVSKLPFWLTLNRKKYFSLNAEG